MRSAEAGTRVVFLGGLGEVGRNMFAVESRGRIVVIDAGLSFPTEEMPGVDLVLPDFTWVADRADQCDGIILTHGHEDHVGALTWLLQKVQAPVFGTPLTLGMARRRMSEFGVSGEMTAVAAPGERSIGPFRCRFLAVSHSIPDTIAVAVDTDDGRIVYTSDIKLDEYPVDGRRTDLDAFAQLGREGVDLLLADSTNAERPGRTPSEAIVGPVVDSIVGAARRRVIVACFASNLHRIQHVCDAAERAGRKVAFVGRSMVANVEVGRELGHLSISDATIVGIEELDRCAPQETVVVCTGSQGEPLSALSLIAAGEHKFVTCEANDTVILSASPIPGNESAVHRVLNALYRAGADVFHAGTAPVHVSGHAAADELSELISVVKPRHFTPVHGEYRQLKLHAKIAEGAGCDPATIKIVEDGDVLELSGGEVRRGDRVPHGTILVDGIGVGDVGPVVLRDRRVLSEDGVVICVVTIDGQSGEILAGPDLITRGFVHEGESRVFLDTAADRALAGLEELEAQGVTDWGAIKKAVRHALGEYLWAETRRRPMILPIVMEV
ncbi:MAG: ribonuclease J [Actinomycetota bacterium]|nr:ribonuclease J [Actinomycetota bacterium]